MVLIVGLGNPGVRYSMSRHNLGFLVVDLLAKRWQVKIDQKGFDALYVKARTDDGQVLLAKPQTFMNLSGLSVRKIVDYFKLSKEELIVVHDDLDLPFGTIRLRAGGGHGGHKGLVSIIEHLGASDFTRVRMGIGKPVQKEMVESYVLSRFTEEEMKVLPEFVATADDAIEEIISTNLQSAMTKYNGKTIKIFCEEVK
ncbi:MAG: aminoacyl-tRNA hydrolase [Smithellaceae bacterium]|nr:aminoacyl-tRNA hydrolase [Smithellaceae bacterium]